MFIYEIAVKILTMMVTFVTFVTLFQNIEIECNGLLPSLPVLPCFKGVTFKTKVNGLVPYLTLLLFLRTAQILYRI